LVVETGVSVENHWPVASHWQTLSHNVVSSTNHPSGIRTHNIIADTPVSTTNKTDCHDIAEILLKVALNTMN
jgi:hypothetical protein